MGKGNACEPELDECKGLMIENPKEVTGKGKSIRTQGTADGGVLSKKQD